MHELLQMVHNYAGLPTKDLQARQQHIHASVQNPWPEFIIQPVYVYVYWSAGAFENFVFWSLQLPTLNRSCKIPVGHHVGRKYNVGTLIHRLHRRRRPAAGNATGAHLIACARCIIPADKILWIRASDIKSKTNAAPDSGTALS